MPDRPPPIPRALSALIGSGDPSCPRCHGDGVVVRFSWPKLGRKKAGDCWAFRKCGCVAGKEIHARS